MAQLQLIKQSTGILIPATPETSDFLQSKCKLGSVLVADFKLVRNPAFHRRFFALLNLGFEYWEPTGGAISSNERKLVNGYARFLASYGGNESALLDAAEQYLEQIASRRITNGISLCKSFDAYRAWVTVEAGHFDAIQLPDGTLRKHPRSIAFASMDETEFQHLYKAALDVLWRWILSRTFNSREEAENAAAQLMSFAG
ncbi:DUF1367 family protein [Citrobacter sp. CK184]|uniref:DUF1367 family protein n=1 Tax=Citrobacter koseri (strain ATCC BAA-895 / CDC 4225-83 / SGSC4696) TaxID=290338 RepID=A8AHQ1_CITK8|nr:MULTISPECIES: DUF1367 family protein [Citrobacter]ABV13014.1 hypothetical protein CKO_01887 [Citrobacter koseri ATCC BAA-895]EJD6489837.1 DUF1367 family protein [Citrobacter koseri]EKU0538948.1 DUF1367 family protein [Citrobacter koseri]EKU8893353.1 DUF1367 family protein [Citrobacter koseri]EKW1002867.1 DUF1367 family protein [Citrobacter koseri]